MLGGGKRGGDYAARNTLQPRYGLGDLQGESPQMEQTRRTIMLYARSPAAVLIEGETGTGKELAAQALHREYFSRRGAPARGATPPFVAINCGAIAESLLEAELFGYEEGAFTGSRRGGRRGLLETANGGTLFLDEIGEMPLHLQPGRCARWKRRPSPGSAGSSRWRSTFASSAPPTTTWSRRFNGATFAPICSTA